MALKVEVLLVGRDPGIADLHRPMMPDTFTRLQSGAVRELEKLGIVDLWSASNPQNLHFGHFIYII